jgi:EAL domain-containing protein (putative c-di-GMP-specific phosphodiesterase class I)
MHRRGTFPPNEFFPVAEEIDLISPLGFWVVTEAVHQKLQSGSKISAEFKMGINISPNNFLKDDFSPNLQKLIEQEKIEAILPGYRNYGKYYDFERKKGI